MKCKQQFLRISTKTSNIMKENYEQEILKILQTCQYAEIDELSKRLFVSPSTIRRKLTVLQNKGLIIRTHGGAQINDENNFFPSFTFRSHQNSFEKKKMALAAIKLIKNGNLIFLDGSTSSFFIAQYLSEFKNIRVITNGIDTLSLLSKNDVNAYSTGGYVSEKNRSVLVGHYAEETIKNFHADIAFFSTQAIDENGEIYDCFEDENVLRKTMIQHASKVVFLANDTKFEKTSPFRLCSLRDVDIVISNEDITKRVRMQNLPLLITE